MNQENAFKFVLVLYYLIVNKPSILLFFCMLIYQIVSYGLIRTMGGVVISLLMFKSRSIIFTLN